MNFGTVGGTRSLPGPANLLVRHAMMCLSGSVVLRLPCNGPAGCDAGPRGDAGSPSQVRGPGPGPARRAGGDPVTGHSHSAL
eukprot:456714-Hanusia_phi.AAC.1